VLLIRSSFVCGSGRYDGQNRRRFAATTRRRGGEGVWDAGHGRVHGRLGSVIVGVGIDIVDVARLEAALARTPALTRRLFAEGERGLPVQSLAARFAAKEAVAKALGGPRGLRWTDAEVVRAADGRPLLRVHGTVAEAASRLGVRHWHLSLSHDAGIATAVVVAEGARPAPAAPAPAGAGSGGAGSGGAERATAESAGAGELLADGQGG
jgi:holo-[acyl-carrier protein] synthase